VQTVTSRAKLSMAYKQKVDSMSTPARFTILRGPALHELIDSLKYSTTTSGRTLPVDFRIEDVGGMFTGYREPVFEANITGIRHCDHHTVFIWGVFTMKGVKGSQRWQTGPSEYTHSPAGSRSGLLLLEPIS